jgi:rhodanese-related sulfurtransferase
MEKLPEFAANHWELFAALLFILGMLIGGPLVRRWRGLVDVGPSEALGLINHQEALVLDIREEHEFKKGHILGSVHVPLSRLASGLQRLEKHRDKPIVAVCATGNRSGRACGLLRRQGFESVYNLRGGVMAWQNANLPLTKKGK